MYIGIIPVVCQSFSNFFKIDSIYLPNGYSDHQRYELEKLCNNVKTIDKFLAISNLVMEFIPQALSSQKTGFKSMHLFYPKTEMEQNTIDYMVGCSHPGIEDFCNSARDIGGIQEIIGGLHGFKNIAIY
jgi:metal-dependent hydrolase (beta-lactamase superfamily II)